MQRKFMVTVEKGEKYFFGEVLELPGCYSQGKTVKELLHNFKEAIELYLEPLPNSGETVQTKRIAIREVVV